MIVRSVRTVALMVAAGAALSARPAMGAGVPCPDAIHTGIPVGASDTKHEVASASALSAVSPGGDVTFQTFAYVYATPAGAYLEDGHPHGWIVPLDGTDRASVLSALAKLRESVPPSKLSAGATAALSPGWRTTLQPCASRA
jgi:hypothetical protein